MFAHQYSVRLNQLFADSSQRSANAKLLIEQPLKEQQLLVDLGKSADISNGTTNNVVGSTSNLTNKIVAMWQCYGRSEYGAAFTQAVAAVALVGTTLRSLDEQRTDQPFDDDFTFGGIHMPPKSNDRGMFWVQVLAVIASVARTIALKNSVAIGSTSTTQALLDTLRVEYAHLRRDAKQLVYAQVGMLLILIQILKICVDDLKNPNIVESILASTSGILSAEFVTAPKSVRVTFHYYLAKHFMFLDKWSEARDELMTACQLFPPVVSKESSTYRNLRRILNLLIFLNAVTGVFPSKQLLNRFPTLKSKYLPLLRCVRKGDLVSFRNLIESSEQHAINLHFFHLTNYFELLVHRQLLRRVFDSTEPKKRIVSLELYGELAKSDEDFSEVFAILIQKSAISGYISYEENSLMLTGVNPFPYAPWDLLG